MSERKNLKPPNQVINTDLIVADNTAQYYNYSYGNEGDKNNEEAIINNSNNHTCHFGRR